MAGFTNLFKKKDTENGGIRENSIDVHEREERADILENMVKYYEETIISRH